LPSFASLPIWANILIFAVAGGAIWLAGTQLSRVADVLSDRTGIGKAFIGALLLGGITSLPEGATTVTASVSGRADIAVNNIFGGVAMQIAILALVDAITTRQPLSRHVHSPTVLVQAMFLIAVLSLAVGGMVVGDLQLFGFGAWTTAVLAVALLGLYSVRRSERHPSWQIAGDDAPPEQDPSNVAERAQARRERTNRRSTRRLLLELLVASAVVLAGGVAVTRAGEALADQTGLGGSFMGALFIALATSLPEISTTLAAARLGQHVMAFSNIFGTNLFDVGLLFVADAAYPGPPVLDEMDRFAQLGALLGIACTTIYVLGILQRRAATVLRMGLDSALVLATYAAGMAALYALR
jgi:cation:H+ antiporter